MTSSRRACEGPLLGLVLVAAACSGGDAHRDARMVMAEVLRDYVAIPPVAELSSHPPDRGPTVGVLTPAWHYTRDGADMPALIMPPPCEIGFRVARDEAPATLRARAGVDFSVIKLLSRDRVSAAFEFEVLVDGDPAFTERITVSRKADPPGSDWVDVGGERGIPVAPGQLVTLRTRALDGDGEPVEPPIALPAGFGRLRLERDLLVPRARSSPEAPNLVLVVMDTLRRDRLSAYGYARPTSPALERLAARGTLFENAHAASSWTWPSTASILTGLLPEEHGVRSAASCYLAQGITTVAEALQSAGVTTAAWTGNPLLTHARNFDQGFEEFHGDRSGFRKTGAFFDEIASWIERRAGRRFFLYVQATEPHHPFVPLPEGARRLAAGVPAGFDRRMMEIKSALRTGAGVAADGSLALDDVASAEERGWASDVYDACVWSGDHWLGELEALLERLELDDETIVVFTSDHGEELFERGFFNHGQDVHAELVRVPLVIAGPGVPIGRRVHTPVSNRRLAPYLAALAGAPLAGLEPPRLFDEDPGAEVLFSTEKGFWDGHANRTILGLRSGDLVLHHSPEDGGTRLYDVAADPLETVDVAGGRPREVERLREELLSRVRALVPRSSAGAGAGAETLRLLQDVGYAGEDE